MPSRRNLIEMTDEERNSYVGNAHTLIIVSNGKKRLPPSDAHVVRCRG